MKILTVIFLFFLFPIINYGQNHYVKMWNEIPNEIKNKIEIDTNNLTKKYLKHLFEIDSLDISNLHIDNIELVENFKNLSFLNASNNEISFIPSNLSIENFNEINFSNTNISLTKLIEFKYNYKRGEFNYSFDTCSTLIIYNNYPEKISVKLTHYNWWNDLSYEWKILFERNAGIYIENFYDISLHELEKIINLEILIIDNQNIEDISVIKVLKNLVIFDCSKNIIIDLKPVFELQNIGVLICNDNEINNLTGIENCKNLEVLVISNNQISEIEEIAKLNNLEYLDISENQINEINILKELQKIEFLNIAYNQINDITILQNIKSLKKVYCSDIDKNEINLLQCKNLDISVLNNGRNAFYLSLFSFIFSATLFSFSFL